MANLADMQPAVHQRVLVFGPPKVGKTEVTGKLAAKHNLLWFDLENGSSTLLKLPAEYKKRIRLIRLPDTRSYPVAIATMLKVVKGGDHSICDEHGTINCPVCKQAGKSFENVNLHKLPKNTIVVIDSFTQLTNSAISAITKGKPDDYKMEYDDWGNLGKLMDIILSHIQQARYNVVCISHESEAEYEDGKKKIVPVAGTRNFSRNVAKYFDHVVYAEVKNKKHVLGSSTDYSTSIITGSRLNIKLEAGAEASLEEIFKNFTDDDSSIDANQATASEPELPADTEQQPAATTPAVTASAVLNRTKLMIGGNK